MKKERLQRYALSKGGSEETLSMVGNASPVGLLYQSINDKSIV